MKLRKATIILLVLFGSIGCDQVSKVTAEYFLEGRGTLSYLGDTFRLTYAINHGAFLGLGASLPPLARTGIFTVFVAIMLVFLLVWMWRKPDISRMGLVALSLLIGGGIGNLIDRVMNGGGVIDFMNLGIGGLRTGIFNVADVWIVVGACLLFFAGDFRDDSRPPGGDPEPDPAPP